MLTISCATSLSSSPQGEQTPPHFPHSRQRIRLFLLGTLLRVRCCFKLESIIQSKQPILFRIRAIHSSASFSFVKVELVALVSTCDKGKLSGASF
jgi:hypothetical protein